MKAFRRRNHALFCNCSQASSQSLSFVTFVCWLFILECQRGSLHYCRCIPLLRLDCPWYYESCSQSWFRSISRTGTAADSWMRRNCDVDVLRDDVILLLDVKALKFFYASTPCAMQKPPSISERLFLRYFYSIFLNRSSRTKAPTSSLTDYKRSDYKRLVSTLPCVSVPQLLSRLCSLASA